MAAGNAQRGQLGFEVEGQRWTLAFTTNALCELEAAFGLAHIGELDSVVTGAPSLRTIRTLFRVGLTDCHPDLDDRGAGELIDAVGGLEPALELVMRAVEQAFPEAAKKGTVDPRPRARRSAPKSGHGTGPSST